MTACVGCPAELAVVPRAPRPSLAQYALAEELVHLVVTYGHTTAATAAVASHLAAHTAPIGAHQ